MNHNFLINHINKIYRRQITIIGVCFVCVRVYCVFVYTEQYHTCSLIAIYRIDVIVYIPVNLSHYLSFTYFSIRR